MTNQIPIYELDRGKGVGRCHNLKLTGELVVVYLPLRGGDIFFLGVGTGIWPIPQ